MAQAASRDQEHCTLAGEVGLGIGTFLTKSVRENSGVCSYSYAEIVSELS